MHHCQSRGRARFCDSVHEVAHRIDEGVRATDEGARARRNVVGELAEKSSGVVTDVDENGVRETGLQAGLVDVKVCAVTEVWSGLKFVRRLKDRKK